MNSQLSELTTRLAQSAGRHSVLKKFGLALAGVLLSFLGLGDICASLSEGRLVCRWCGNGFSCFFGGCYCL